MAPPHFHDTHEIVIAATLWLMLRYQKTGCKNLAHMVEQHLLWMQTSATSPALANACERLSHAWRSVSGAPSPHPALH